LSAKQLIAQFKIDQHEFHLYLHEYEIQLHKVAAAVPKVRLSSEAWLNFEDEARMDDVGQNINAFAVMIQCRKHLRHYLAKHPLRYFYFHASTPRKARIYPRFAERLCQQLSDYDFCQNDESFYFYRRD